MPKQSAPQELAQIAPKLVEVTNEVCSAMSGSGRGCRRGTAAW